MLCYQMTCVGTNMLNYITYRPTIELMMFTLARGRVLIHIVDILIDDLFLTNVISKGTN